MRFRLRTLLILSAILPPVIAAAWFAPGWLKTVPIDSEDFGSLIGALVLTAVTAGFLALIFAVSLAACWLWELIARSDDNRSPLPRR